jgi:hypothetical protein
VMPAFEPGWVADFCRCRCPCQRARRPPSVPFPFAVERRDRPSPPHRVGAPCRIRDACVPACAPVRATKLARVHPRTRAPQP